MPRSVWWLVAVLVVVLAAGVLVLDRRQAQRGAPSLLALPWGREGSREPLPRAPRAAARPGASGEGAGRIAIIVDELGARPDVFGEILALGRPLTVAVLPELPFSRRMAREAARAGLEVLLQVPLEPYRFPEVDPGPGTLLVAMAPEDVTRKVRQQLATLPGAAGVATYMGSRFTEDRVRMQALLDGIRGEGRFFVDALTTQASVAYDLARAAGLPAARRQVWLDPEESEATVRARLLAVERWAERRGSVVAIGHGRLLTVRLLGEALVRWEARGFRLVPVSHLVERAA